MILYLLIIIRIMKYIGAHISKDVSFLKTMHNMVENNGNALQIFVSSPMNSSHPDITKIKVESTNIKKFLDDNNFKLVVHGSYVINLANSKINKRYVEINDRWWIKLLINELDSAEILNAIGVVIHVGKYTTFTIQEASETMYQSIKYIISYLKENNYNTKLILETPAGVGTELLTDVNDFVKFYNKFTKTEKSYLKVCLDTAHIWSSGYDIKDYLTIFKNIMDSILVIHLNNSKVKKGAKIDRHEFIDMGLIGKKDLEVFLKTLKSNPIIILEKPNVNYKEEIKWINKNY
jgi:deoxyribonuclease IV